ncbi:ABC transporter permease [Fredinandcohnia onubensis]|uniref:ABC transporter permease n=1 Tax=Fredinandcohnia onubensis TaxID=1571209 RepID=UPI0015D4BE1E|nr:FtsX-like permease family protein [Fredinandcohnia onubensis]
MPIYLKKAWRDLARQKMRTFIILFSIAICLSTIGTLLNTNHIFQQSLYQNLQHTNMADLTFYTSPFEEDISYLTKEKGIKDVEAKTQIRVRVEINNEFKNFELLGFSTDSLFRINKIKPLASQLKSSNRELFLEKSTLEYFNQSIGDKVTISIPGKKPKQFTINGGVEDLYRIPTKFSGLGYGYLPNEVLGQLGLTTSKNIIHLTFDSSLSGTGKKKVIQKAKTALDAKNITVYRTVLSEETLFLRKTVVNTILLILIVLGIFSFFLSFLLIIHLFYRMVTEQIFDLSIQKVLGATPLHFWKQYMVTLFLFGSIVFLLSAPLSVVISYYFSDFILKELNIGKAEFTISPIVFSAILILSFIVPILAAVFPVNRVLKIPVIQGLFNIHKSYVKEKRKGSKRYFNFYVLSLRNAMTKKVQLITNILMLSFGGAIIIACLGLNNSLQMTVAELNQILDYESEWSIRTSFSKEDLVESIKELNGVEQAEAWTIRNAVISDSTNEQNALLHSVPSVTEFIHPSIQDGQWLDHRVPNSIVISSDLKHKFRDIKPGDIVTIRIGKDKKQLKVIGIMDSHLTGPSIYINDTDYHQWLKNQNINRLLIKKEKNDHLPNVQKTVEHWLNANQVTVEASDNVKNIHSRFKEMIRIIIFTLLFVGILFSTVGMLNMMTAMSINVLERKKEFGIIRSIGGTQAKVYQLVLGEAILIAILSWIISVVLSSPLYAFLSEKIGNILLNSSLPSGITWYECLLWLGISLFSCMISSFFISRKTGKQPLRELM